MSFALNSQTPVGNLETAPSAVRAALTQKFGGAVIAKLEDEHKLNIVFDEKQAELSIFCGVLSSKWHLVTGHIVPDSLATETNDQAILAHVDWPNENSFPAGDIVIYAGRHTPLLHRGLGAKHLTGNVIEQPSRNLYPQEENKTEAALQTLMQVLKTAKTLYRVNESRKNASYVFYSPSLRRGVITYFNENDGQYHVVTDRPENFPEKTWGNDNVRLSGAIAIPDTGVSITPPPSYHDTERTKNPKTETQPVSAHGSAYIDVDSTEELIAAIARVRGLRHSQTGALQGFYDIRHRQAVLIAKNLTKESAPAVLLHEIADQSMESLCLGQRKHFHENLLLSQTRAQKILICVARNTRDPFYGRTVFNGVLRLLQREQMQKRTQSVMEDHLEK